MGNLTSNGTVALNGTSGATNVTVASGTLSLGSANRLVATGLTIASGATLKLGGNETVGSLTSAGTLDKTGVNDTLTASSGSYDLNAGAVINADLGTGTLTSNGNAALNGSSAAAAVNVVNGTLTLGAAERLANGATVTVANGATLKLGGDETVGGLTLSGTLEPATVGDTLTASTTGYTLRNGAIVNANLGTGTLTSDGIATALNAPAAATTVNVVSGRLTLAAADLLADGATVNVSAPGTLRLGGNDTITQLNLSGQLEASVSSTLTATATTGYALNGGTTQINANLGAGKLSATGTSQLNGTTAAKRSGGRSQRQADPRHACQPPCRQSGDHRRRGRQADTAGQQRRRLGQPRPRRAGQWRGQVDGDRLRAGQRDLRQRPGRRHADQPQQQHLERALRSHHSPRRDRLADAGIRRPPHRPAQCRHQQRRQPRTWRP